MDCSDSKQEAISEDSFVTIISFSFLACACAFATLVAFVYKNWSKRSSINVIVGFVIGLNGVYALAQCFGATRYFLLQCNAAAAREFTQHLHLNDTLLCVGQSMVAIYAEASCCLWMILLEITLCHRIRTGRNLHVVLCTLLALICALVPAAVVYISLKAPKWNLSQSDVLGEDDNVSGLGFCWLSKCLDLGAHFLWGLITGKLWQLLAFCLVPIIFLYFRFKNHGCQANQRFSWEYRCLALLPLGHVFFKSIGNVRFIMHHAGYSLSDGSDATLMTFQSVFESLIPWFTAVIVIGCNFCQSRKCILWCKDTTVMKRYRKVFKKKKYSENSPLVTH